MAYVATALTEYSADELAKVIDLPKQKNILNLPKHKIEHPSLESVDIDRG
jgi:hypothetical protein